MSFFVLQFCIVLVPIEDVANFYGFDISIDGINNTLLPLIVKIQEFPAAKCKEETSTQPEREKTS